MPKAGHVTRKAALMIVGGIASVTAVTFALAVERIWRETEAAAAQPEKGPDANSRGPAAAPSPVPSASQKTVVGAATSGGTAPISVPQFRIKRILDIPGPFRHGDYVWNDTGVPHGPVVITIDLKAQTLSVFRDGYEIGAAVILYGATDKPSPLGVFPILQKDADHYSSLYDNAPMPFSLRLTHDGVFIHGSDVKWGNATHGCIGVPVPFARKLFGVAKLGDPVIVTDGKMMDVAAAAIG